MKNNDQFQRYLDTVIHYGNMIVKAALYVTIAGLFLATVLVVAHGDASPDRPETWYSRMIWPILLGSMWVLIYVPVYLVGATISNKYFRKGVHATLRPQFMLLLGAIIAAIVFVIAAMWVSSVR